MKKEGKIRKRLFPVLFMLMITLVFISITTVIYTFTKDTIALQESLRLKRSVLYAAGVHVPEQPEDVQTLYLDKVKEVKDDEEKTVYYVVYADDYTTVMSYVVVATGPGLWGEITAALGYDKGLNTLTGIEIIDQNETPGLGGRISETWFKEQFRGKRVPLSIVSEGEPADLEEFQAITGASYSSAAIKDLVNVASRTFPSMIKALK